MNGRRDGLLVGLFGPDVMVGASAALADLGALFPNERAAIAAWAPRRRHEFAAGRVCARQLLARCGVSPAPLLIAANGGPCWPPGFAGSLSHTDGVCVAAVAPRNRVGGIGIDVEVARGLDETMWDLVCTPTELDWLYQQADADRARLLAAALLSAKESSYKCLVGDRAVPFEPCAIGIDWNGRAADFHARVTISAATGGVQCASVSGRLLVRQGWVLSGVTQAPIVGSAWKC